MAKKPKTIEHLDASIGRWKTRLKRAVTMIDKLEKQRKRVEKAAANPPKPQPKATAATVQPPKVSDVKPLPPDLLKEYRETADEPAIPTFLRRTSKDDAAAAEIRQERDDQKKAKARGRIAKMKAKQSGETKKMPLTGRAALDAIRNG
jgi:hypothetical protein